MDSHALGTTLLIAAAVLALLGLAALTGALGWFGHLPGDLHYSGRNVKVYFPVTTMILVSIVISIAFAVGRRF
jgi:hypothetical protein